MRLTECSDSNTLRAAAVVAQLDRATGFEPFTLQRHRPSAPDKFSKINAVCSWRASRSDTFRRVVDVNLDVSVVVS